MSDPRLLELRTGVLTKNDRLARALRARLHEAGVCTVNVVSSPGSGKTRLLAEVLARMTARGLGVAALVGDCATENDAERLRASGAPVRQIVTHGLCHLEAAMVEEHLLGWKVGDVSFLVIENVGNLVCPSSYDLGEDLRIVALSVTEGEDKPAKYPVIFSTADLVVLTKLDMAETAEWDREAAHRAIQDVRPGVRTIETSARTGSGVDELIEAIVARRDAVLGRVSTSTAR